MLKSLSTTALITLALLTAGCGVRLKEDPSEPAIDAGYMTAELESCGVRSLGLSTCSAPLSSEVELKVQGVYKGQMRVVSTACNVDITQAYGMNEVMSFKFPLIDKRCLVTATVVPDFPKSWRNAVSVYGLRGVAAFRADEGTGVVAHTFQSGEAFPSATLSVPVRGSSDIRIVLAGCGVPPVQLNRMPENGAVAVPLKDYVNLSERPVCVLDGFAFNFQNDLTILGLYSRYSETFAPLAIPEVVVNESMRSISVRSAPVVSITALDNRISVSSNVRFNKVDLSQPHLLRLYTVKGRSVIGEWNPQTKAWKWMQ